MKLLVVIDNLKTGGIATSLYNFLSYVPEKISCDLLVFDPNSVNQERLPQQIHLLPSNRRLTLLGLTQRQIWKKNKGLAFYRGILVLLSKILGGDKIRHIHFYKLIQPGHYDLALSYSHDTNWRSFSGGCNGFVAECVSADRKCCYIHQDYELAGGNHPSQNNIFDYMQEILCVSEGCRRSFASCFPKQALKTRVMENFTDTARILTLAKEGYVYEKGIINFVTVCRLSEEKGIERCLNVFSEIYNKGLRNFTWTIVGDGPERSSIEDKIQSLGLKDRIILVGQKDNPYYYMKNASYFILPSLHEAAPMVFGECQVLGIPIISTATVSARELVADRNLGIVCENNTEGLYNVISTVLENPDQQEILQRRMKLAPLINENAVHQQERLLES